MKVADAGIIGTYLHEMETLQSHCQPSGVKNTGHTMRRARLGRQHAQRFSPVF